MRPRLRQKPPLKPETKPSQAAPAKKGRLHCHWLAGDFQNRHKPSRAEPSRAKTTLHMTRVCLLLCDSRYMPGSTRTRYWTAYNDAKDATDHHPYKPLGDRRGTYSSTAISLKAYAQGCRWHDGQRKFGRNLEHLKRLVTPTAHTEIIQDDVGRGCTPEAATRDSDPSKTGDGLIVSGHVLNYESFSGQAVQRRHSDVADSSPVGSRHTNRPTASFSATFDALADTHDSAAAVPVGVYLCGLDPTNSSFFKHNGTRSANVAGARCEGERHLFISDAAAPLNGTRTPANGKGNHFREGDGMNERDLAVFANLGRTDDRSGEVSTSQGQD